MLGNALMTSMDGWDSRWSPDNVGVGIREVRSWQVRAYSCDRTLSYGLTAAERGDVSDCAHVPLRPDHGHMPEAVHWHARRNVDA